MLNRSEIKLGARAAVWQRPLGPVLAVLLARLPGLILDVSVYSVVRYLIAGRIDLHSFFIGAFALLISLFVTLPMNVSLAGYFIALVSGHPQRVQSMLAIFSDKAQYRHAYFTGLNVFLRQAVWSGIALLPCLLSNLMRAAGSALPAWALSLLWAAGVASFIFAFSFCTLRYAFAPYFAWEYTYLTAQEAVDMSVSATRGRLWELLTLALSFTPWYLLSAATAGVAYLFVAPYVSAVFAAYYLIFKRQEGILLPTPKEYTDV